MRTLIGTAVFALACAGVSEAQVCGEPPAPRTRLEELMAEVGAVIVRGSSRVGEVRDESGTSVVVEAIEVRDAIAGRRERGISVEIRSADRRGPGAGPYVDWDEIPALLQGLDYAARLDEAPTALERFAVDYRTKGGLLVTMYGARSGNRIAVTSDAPGTGTARLDAAELIRVAELVKSAYESLGALGSAR